MNLTVEYEEIKDLNLKVMTIADLDSDIALAQWEGEALERLLEKLVKGREYDWHIVNIHEYSDALSYDEYDYPPNGVRVIFTTGSEEFMGVHSNALNMY